MTIAEFRATLANAAPPANLPPAVAALWHDGKGEWNAAHDAAQSDESRDGSWVHAYLHRKEGDTFNAGYWYRRAGRPAATGTLDAEWESIVKNLLPTD